MASSREQINTLIIKLTNKSAAGEMTWEPSAQPKTYQTRVGNHLIQIKGSSGNALNRNTSMLTVLRLDGNVVEKFSSSAIGLLGEFPATMISPTHGEMLDKLYEIVSGDTGDISELLKLL